MSPLVKKEIRLLLPGVATGCALGLANLLFRFDGNGSLQNGWAFALAFLFCGGVAVMLALNSFGAEVSSGTFSTLLAQPIPRQKIWDMKILTLAASLLIVGLFWSACGIVRLNMVRHDLNLLDLFTGVGTFGLVVFSGGLWTVLLFRQIAAAFWLTVLVPGCLLVMLAGLFADHSAEFIQGVMAGVLGLYSLAGFFLARWLFFRAQDLQWTGGTLVLPEMRGLARLKSVAGSLGAQTPRAALWRKEIQLHQSQFIVAFGLLMLHLGVIVTRHFGHFRKNSTTEFILESFWTLWLVMPLLVGCAAVAEERRLGTHESQLCLPVQRRTQFKIKLLVVLGLSLLFGAFMPVLLEGFRILPDLHLQFGSAAPNRQIPLTSFVAFFYNLFELVVGLEPLWLLTGGVVLIAGISFYFSTLGRNTLQTLAPAVAGTVFTWFLLMVATIPQNSLYQFDLLWHGPLPYFIVLPAMAVTLLALAKGNYQHVLPNWKLGRLNLLALLSVFALSVMLTSAIYHRFWEKLTPFEPAHGPARLTLANPPTLTASAQGNGLFLRLPDGRTWTGGVGFDRDTTRLEAFLGNFKMTLNDHLLMSGSNWLTANRAFWDLVGIKTDGTLWVSEKPRFAIRQQGKWKIINEEEWRQLVQFGTETNWTSLVPWNTAALLTKNDGTLWRWGPESFNYDGKTNRWPGLRSFTPVRLGDESNWVEAFQFRRGFGLRKTDGSVWRSLEGATNGYSLLEVESNFWLFSTQASHQQKLRSTAEIYDGLTYRTGIRDDGTFRIWEHLVPILSRKQNYTSFVWTNIDLQIGVGTNWLTVAGMGNQAVTLKNDGSLWLWNLPNNRNWSRDQDQIEKEILDTVPVQLGTHSDWVAISSNGSLVVTLAADGSLWYWPLGGFQWTVYNNDNIRITQLLDISRKPQLLGNVFSTP